MRAYIHAMNPKMRKQYLRNMERKKIGWKDVIGLAFIIGGLVLAISFTK